MQILMNAPQDKLELFTSATGVAFLPMKESGKEPGKDSVAVVVPGKSFAKDLSAAVSLGTPVMVVAGGDNEAGNRCAREAAGRCVPEPCILVKKGDKVCSMDGRVIADAVGQGIGVRAVLKAAEYALQNRLYPDPLVWEDVEPTEPVVFGEEIEGGGEKKAAEPAKRGNKVVPLQSGEMRLEGIVDAAKVVAVFKATPDADSGKVAHDLAARLQGVHMELAASPSSFKYYGKNLEEAVASGRYVHYDGGKLTGCGILDAKWMVVEIDTDILVAMPQVVDLIYKKAERVVHAVGQFDEGRVAVETWLNSGWNLHAVIPGKAFEQFRRVFGEIVLPNAAALQFA